MTEIEKQKEEMAGMLTKKFFESQNLLEGFQNVCVRNNADHWQLAFAVAFFDMMLCQSFGTTIWRNTLDQAFDAIREMQKSGVIPEKFQPMEKSHA